MALSRSIAILSLAGASVALLAGCSVARQQESVGQYVDGSVVTSEIKAKLAQDPATSAANINVKTIGGGEVQLSGFARSEKERSRAGAIARSVKGVTSVRNDLVVKP